MGDSDEPRSDGILTPEDLELDDSEVQKLGDNRYLIDTDGPSTPDAGGTAGQSESDHVPGANLEGQEYRAANQWQGRGPDDGSDGQDGAPADGSDQDERQQPRQSPRPQTQNERQQPRQSPQPPTEEAPPPEDSTRDGRSPDRSPGSGRGPTGDGRANHRSRADQPQEPGGRDGGRPESRQGGHSDPPLTDVPATYAIDVAVKTDNGVDHRRIASSDVREAFEELLRFYARQVEPASDPEEVISVLLSASDLDLDLDLDG